MVFKLFCLIYRSESSSGNGHHSLAAYGLLVAKVWKYLLRST
jgi:hypothetical protein